MRLLQLQDDGGFGLIEVFGKNIPQYAILSHTWGADYEEITLRDLTENAYKSKVGYRKLTFCGQQAAKYNLQYFWVDTCCIDKSSSAELSEAINSMFRWYHEAAKCYVYLSDVSVGSPTGTGLPLQQKWRLAFQHSRWFTRGWTLQELLAPKSVEFFSVEGERLGGRGSMVQELHDITGISAQALQGRPLPQFSVEERMSWAAKRETKREEDAAYSLLGIFDIHMPLIYGEGRKKALIRLGKEIKDSLRDEWPGLSQTPTDEVVKTEGEEGEKKGEELQKYKGELAEAKQSAAQTPGGTKRVTEEDASKFPTLINLGNIYKERGKLDEAEKRWQGCWKGLRRYLEQSTE